MRKNCLSLIFGLMAAAAGAAPVSPQQALGIAERFVGQSEVNYRMKKAPAGTLKVVYTQMCTPAGNDPAFYVVGRGGDSGYVFVAADDRVSGVIGYAPNGTFNPNSIPASMSGMIDSWTRQMEWLSTHPEAKVLAPEAVDMEIAPLLGDIKWDQGDPYNRACPTVPLTDMYGNSAGTGPGATGCVATALSQIMYYHKWPQSPSGSISYSFKDDNRKTVNVSVDLDGVTYDWDKMLPSLTKNSDSEAIEQVSKLLFHVGASFESVYGTSTGATDVSVAPALKKYFNYDKGISYRLRDFYTASDWDEIIMTELKASRPIAYGGITKKWEGHFFVLDGVDALGYYHINWGWSGMEDGYYRLALLEPGSQGIGGADSGEAFHYGQNMITGIAPAGTTDAPEQICFTSDYLTTFSKKVSRQGTAKLVANEVWNNSATPCTANLGFVLVDEQGNVLHKQWVRENTEYGVAYGEETLSCSFMVPDNIPVGKYTVRPAYSLSTDNFETVHFVMLPNGRYDRYEINVTDQNVEYSTVGAYKLTMLDVTADTGEIRSGEPTKFTVKLHNDGGEFHGPVQLRLYIKGKDKVFGKTDLPKKAIWVDVPGYGDSEIEFEATLDVPGHNDYVFCLRGNEGMTDEDGYHQTAKNLCSKSGFTIIGGPLPPVMSLADAMIVTSEAEGKVPLNDVCVKAYIENEGGEWTGRMRMAIWDPDTWSRTPLGYIEFAPVTVDAECEQWVNLIDGEFPENMEIGKTYELALRDPSEDDDAMVPSYYNFIEVTVGEPVEKNAILALDDISFIPETIVAGTPATIQFHVSNTGYSYNGDVTFHVLKGEDVCHTSQPAVLSVPRQDAGMVEFTETFELPTADDYTISLRDAQGNEIGSREGLTFTADPSVLEMTSVQIDPEILVYGESAEFKFEIANTGFLYEGDVKFDLSLNDEVRFTSEAQKVEIARGKSETITFTETPELEESDSYVLHLLDEEGNVIGTLEGIELTKPVSLDSIKAEAVSITGNNISVEGAVSIAVYDTAGRLMIKAGGESVDISALPAGTYLLNAVMTDKNIAVKFIK